LEEKPALARAAARAAAALVAAAVIASAAWNIGERLSSRGSAAQIARHASVAHIIYATEPYRPAEAHAEKAQLLDWLSARLGMRVEAPDLAAAGFSFIGGELVPGGAGPAALVMYRNKAGQRVTLYWGPEFKRARDTGPRYAGSGNGARVYYWLDEECGYAVASADLGEKELLRVALLAYAQLEK
jgi:anti-sigma factor RsiW